MDTRLSRIDDSAVIKKWVENLLVSLKYETNHQIEQLEKSLKQSIEKIKQDNLLVPGLIGEKESFSNLKEYLLHDKQTISKQL